MMESGGLHGPREDDALKREVRSELQAGRATRVEEWREPEPSGEDQPEATVTAGTPEGRARPPAEEEAIEIRSDLARHLDHKVFPANRERILDTLREHQATDQLIEFASRLPEGVTFTRFHDVLVALDLPVETRSGQ